MLEPSLWYIKTVVKNVMGANIMGLTNTLDQ